MEKKTPPPENSIGLRIICAMMAILAILASYIFGDSPVPVVEFNLMQIGMLVLSIWLVIAGGVFSYYYRGGLPESVKKLVKVGAVLIVLNLARELWDANLYAFQFQFVSPLMHSLVAAAVLTSFEMRSRSDIISSATFGLLLLAVAGASGKSILFGAIVFIYVCLGAALLMLSCKSQTQNEIAPVKKSTLARQTTRGTTSGAVALTLLLLPVASVAAFCVIPRLDDEADNLSARIRAVTTSTLYKMRKSRQKANGQGESEILVTNHPLELTSGPNRLKTVRRKEAARQKIGDPSLRPPAPAGDGDKKGDKKNDGSDGIPSGIPNKVPSLDGPQSKDQPTVDVPTTGPAPVDSTAQGSPPPSVPPAATPPAPPKPNDQKPAAGAKKRPKAGKQNEPASGKKPAASSSKKPATGGKKIEDSKLVHDPTSKNTKLVNSNEELNSQSKQEPKKEPITIMDEQGFDVGAAQQNPEEHLFTLACTRSVYTKALVLDKFDGRRWTRSSPAQLWEVDPTTQGLILDYPPFDITYATPVMELAQSYTVENNLGFYMPFAGIPQRVSLLEPAIVDHAGTIRMRDPILKGTRYKILAQLPVYALDEMRNERELEHEDPIAADSYLQVPDNQSAKMFELAAEIAGTEGNRFTQAERIMMHLRKKYKYSLDLPKSNSNENLVDSFLFKNKVGDCKSFASSFVLMCRAMEMPARCVSGYLPGDFDPVTGATHIKRKHAHAWGEVFIPPYGWVPFDPTPNGQLPARPEENYYDYKRLQKEIDTYGQNAQAKSRDAIKTALEWIGKVLGAIALVVSAVAFFYGLRAARAIVKSIILARKQRHPASVVRERLLKRLRKIGMQRDPADTSAEVVAKLRKILCERCENEALADRLSEFMQTYNATYFGQEDRMSELREKSREIESLIKHTNKNKSGGALRSMTPMR